MPPLLLSPDDLAQHVLSLRPRVAAFDCDGTLWEADSGMEFFYWELREGLIPEEVARAVLARYDQYLDGKVSEEAMCGEMVQIHAGIAEAEIVAGAERFFAEHIAARMFPEMGELVKRLRDSGCEIWAVSSTNHWVVRAGVAPLGIPGDHVLGACVEIENQCATNRLIRHCSGEGKAEALRIALPSPPDVALGNSVHDAAMLALAHNAVAVNPTDALAAIAAEQGWPIYRPAAIPEIELRTRRADQRDALGLARLINLAFKPERFFTDKDRTSPQQVCDLMSKGEFFVAHRGNELLACIYLENRGESWYFGLLSTEPSRQRQGLARRLLQESEARARAAGAKRMDLTVVNLRLELPPLYRKLGYVEVGTKPFPEDQSATQPCHLIVMSKPLV
jgi:phosphoserine phosphatase/predicted N-acetyltransferase YhbS